MAIQQLWRGALSIVENPNGTYAVIVSERWEHGIVVEPARYDDLSWKEVVDVVYSTADTFTSSRRKQWRTVTTSGLTQASLF